MLVLSRKVGESIIIGDEVAISVLNVSGKTVKLGIAAPLDVTVHREEIYKIVSETQDSLEEKESSNS